MHSSDTTPFPRNVPRNVPLAGSLALQCHCDNGPFWSIYSVQDKRWSIEQNDALLNRSTVTITDFETISDCYGKAEYLDETNKLLDKAVAFVVICKLKKDRTSFWIVLLPIEGHPDEGLHIVFLPCSRGRNNTSQHTRYDTIHNHGFLDQSAQLANKFALFQIKPSNDPNIVSGLIVQEQNNNTKPSARGTDKRAMLWNKLIQLIRPQPLLMAAKRAVGGLVDLVTRDADLLKKATVDLTAAYISPRFDTYAGKKHAKVKRIGETLDARSVLGAKYFPPRPPHSDYHISINSPTEGYFDKWAVSVTTLLSAIGSIREEMTKINMTADEVERTISALSLQLFTDLSWRFSNPVPLPKDAAPINRLTVDIDQVSAISPPGNIPTLFNIPILSFFLYRWSCMLNNILHQSAT
jgi:hypothetical protein